MFPPPASSRSSRRQESVKSNASRDGSSSSVLGTATESLVSAAPTTSVSRSHHAQQRVSSVASSSPVLVNTLSQAKIDHPVSTNYSALLPPIHTLALIAPATSSVYALPDICSLVTASIADDHTILQQNISTSSSTNKSTKSSVNVSAETQSSSDSSSLDDNPLYTPSGILEWLLCSVITDYEKLQTEKFALETGYGLLYIDMLTNKQHQLQPLHTSGDQGDGDEPVDNRPMLMQLKGRTRYKPPTSREVAVIAAQRADLQSYLQSQDLTTLLMPKIVQSLFGYNTKQSPILPKPDLTASGTSGVTPNSSIYNPTPHDNISRQNHSLDESRNNDMDRNRANFSLSHNSWRTTSFDSQLTSARHKKENSVDSYLTDTPTTTWNSGHNNSSSIRYMDETGDHAATTQTREKAFSCSNLIISIELPSRKHFSPNIQATLPPLPISLPPTLPAIGTTTATVPTVATTTPLQNLPLYSTIWQFGSVRSYLESFVMFEDEDMIPPAQLDADITRTSMIKTYLWKLHRRGRVIGLTDMKDALPKKLDDLPRDFNDHRFFVMNEMKYVRGSILEGSRARIAGARKCAKMVERYWIEIRGASRKAEEHETKRLRRLAKFCVHEVRKRWKLIELVVLGKKKELASAEHARLGKQQLNAMLEHSTAVLSAQQAHLLGYSGNLTTGGPIHNNGEGDDSNIELFDPSRRSSSDSGADSDSKLMSESQVDIPIEAIELPEEQQQQRYSALSRKRRRSVSFENNVDNSSTSEFDQQSMTSDMITLHGVQKRRKQTLANTLGYFDDHQNNKGGDSSNDVEEKDMDYATEDDNNSDEKDIDTSDSDHKEEEEQDIEDTLDTAEAEETPEEEKTELNELQKDLDLSPDELLQRYYGIQRMTDKPIIIDKVSAPRSSLMQLFHPVEGDNNDLGSADGNEEATNTLRGDYQPSDEDQEDESIASDEDMSSDTSDGEDVEMNGLHGDLDLSLQELLQRYRNNHSVDDEEETEGADSEDETVEENAELESSAAFVETDETKKDRLKGHLVDAPTGSTLASTAVKTPLPSLLRGSLREYQHVGLDWLASLYDNNLNGILADEMGLGKTIQTIALLAHLACDKGIWGPHLIVVPTSVMLNWEIEFKRWCPGFKVLTYYGSIKERKEHRIGWTKPNAFHICITSYQLVVTDQKAFRRKAWEYLILDEAHNIKNFRSQRWQTLLNFNSRRRLLLTGTPLQNNLMELWSLLYFLMPHGATSALPTGFASQVDFQAWFSRPVDQVVEGVERMDEEMRATITRLHTILRPFILRRLKSEVEKQMPGKHEHVVHCRLSKRQRFLYDDFMSRSQTKETLACGNFLSIINCLMQLRKVCNHPDMFEVRPIVTSFAVQRGVVSDYQINELLVRRQLLAGVTDGSISSDTLISWGLRLSPTASFPSTNALEQMSDVQQMVTTMHVHNGFTHLITDCQTRLQVLEERSLRTRVTMQQEPKANLMEKLYTIRFQYRQLRASQSRWVYMNRINTQRCTSAHRLSTNDGLISLLSTCTSYTNIARMPVLVCEPRAYMTQTNTLGALVQSYAQREKVMRQVLGKFAMITPRVKVMSGLEVENDTCVASTTTTTMAILQALSPERDIFHRVQLSLSIAFPDKWLLQYDCGKLQKLGKLLRELKAGEHRVLLFTQMTKMLDILEIFLNMHGHRYLRLDGSTKPEQRQLLTDRFNNDKRILVFISSTRAGGIGINMTAADTVIFYDSDWNPSMDAQAQDRVHRIGQTRDVHIYRLVSEHTIEENILRKARQKRLLDQVVIQDAGFTTDALKTLDWRDLFVDNGPLAIDAESRSLAPLQPATSQQQQHKSSIESSIPARGLGNAELEQALAQVEDEADVQALQQSKSEIAIELADFNEPEATYLKRGNGNGTTEAREDDTIVQVQLQNETVQITSIDDYMFRWRCREMLGHFDASWLET